MLSTELSLKRNQHTHDITQWGGGLVQFSCSVVSLCDPTDCSMPGFPVHHQLLEHAQTHVHWVSDVIKPSHPLCPLLLLPSSFPSIRVFSNESVLCIRWPKYWSFSFSISPSNEHPGLISFRMDWLDLRAVLGILKSLLQHHSSKASILQHSAFFMVQLSHPYITTRKTVALTRRTFVSKVMSLLFNMLSRLVIAFPPSGKCLLILCLQSPSAVINQVSFSQSWKLPLPNFSGTCFVLCCEDSMCCKCLSRTWETEFSVPKTNISIYNLDFFDFQSQEGINLWFLQSFQCQRIKICMRSEAFWETSYWAQGDAIYTSHT